MILGVDPKVDYAFRKLFASQANSDLLIDLLNAILNPPPDQRIVSVEILTPFNEKDTAADKETILDIKARDQFGRQYNVEMEMSAPSKFPNRALYYWAVLHAGQLAVGEGYDLLQPTVSICFVNRTLFPAVPTIIWIFSCAAHGIRIWFSVRIRRCMSWSCRSLSRRSRSWLIRSIRGAIFW